MYTRTVRLNARLNITHFDVTAEVKVDEGYTLKVVVSNPANEVERFSNALCVVLMTSEDGEYNCELYQTYESWCMVRNVNHRDLLQNNKFCTQILMPLTSTFEEVANKVEDLEIKALQEAYSNESALVADIRSFLGLLKDPGYIEDWKIQ